MLPKSFRAAAKLFAAAVLLAATLLCAPSAARADGPPGSGSGRQRGPPPPEALAACEQKTAGAACSYSHEGNERTGVCWAPEDRPLACKPEHPPQEGGGSGSGPRR